MTTDRFIVDTAGTLIDIQTRDIFDYVSDVCPLLNELSEENKQLKQRISELELLNDGLNYALKNIKKIDVEIDVGDDE